MRQHTSPSAGSTVVDKLKVYEGGTGVTDPSTILAAMDAIPASLINQPNGVAGLNSAGQLSSAVLAQDVTPTISLVGPSSVIRNSSTLYAINNHDAFTNYVVSAVGGTAALEDTGIRFIAGNTPMAGSITVNDRTVNITVTDYMPVAPVLSGIDTGGLASTAAIVLTTGNFTMQGITDTHLNTDWQIATDAAFTNIVAQSMADATNKLTWTANGLTYTTTYYARARHRSSLGYTSNWSSTVTVTTKAAYLLNVEEATLSPSTEPPVSGDSYGAVSMSADGSRVLVGSHLRDNASLTDSGVAYVFVRTGTTWTLEQKIAPSDPAANDDFGGLVALSADGTRCAVAAMKKINAGGGTNTGGTVYVFVRNTTTNVWTQETKLYGDNPTNNYLFGSSLCIDDSGTRIGVACYQEYACYIFTRTGTAWAKEARFGAGAADGSGNYLYLFRGGYAFDTDATRIVIGNPSWNDGTYSERGRAWIYKRTGTTWALEAIIQSSEAAGNNSFGTSVAMDSAGTRVVIGAHHQYHASQNLGRAYVFTRTGTTWVLEVELKDDTFTGTNRFGSSVSIDASGARIVVAASGANSNTGRAIVFGRSGATWPKLADYTGSGMSSSGYFGDGQAYSNPSSGISIAKSGNRVAIGAWNKNGAGGAYVFRN